MPNDDKSRRLITRADFDGLVCALLLMELDLIDDIVFVHPKDVADGKVEITDRDITTNVPYDPRCYLAFDHHASEAIKLCGDLPDNFVLDPEADSASRVVYRYYGGRERFPAVSPQMMVRGGQGRRGPLHAGGDPQPVRLGPAELHHGSAHRAGPLPRLQDLQPRL